MDESDVTEASTSEFWENVITAEDGMIGQAVHTLQLRMHNFFKAKSSVRVVMSKVRNVAKISHKQNIKELFKRNSKPLPRLGLRDLMGVQRFLWLKESMLVVRDLLNQMNPSF